MVTKLPLNLLFAVAVMFTLSVSAADEDYALLENLPGVADAERVNELLGQATRNIGENNGKAIKYAKEALAIALEYGRPEGEFQSLVMLGKIYQDAGLSDTALAYYYEAVSKYRGSFGQLALGNLFNSIGAPLMSLQGTDEALDYYQKAAEIGQGSGDKAIVAAAKLNYGTVLEKQGDLGRAQQAYAEAAGMLLDLGQEIDYAIAINNMGLIDIANGENNLALRKFAEVLQVGRELDNRRLRILAYLGRGEVRTQMQGYDVAEVDLLKALQLARAFSSRELEQRAHQLLAALYKHLNRFQEALTQTELWTSLEHQHMNSEVLDRITSLQTVNEIEQQHRQIALLQKDAEIKAITLKRQSLVGMVTNSSVAILVLVILFGWLQFRAKNRLAALLLDSNEELSRQATTDPLTGLYNRRAMLELMDKEVRRFNRTGEEFVIAIGDIDHFKRINDQYGHDCGDEVLISVTRLMQQGTRVVDTICRWGGEEFLILFQGTDFEGGRVAAEKIRTILSDNKQQCGDNKFPVTLTIGCCSYDGSVAIGECLKLADEALYRGKANGRNRVEMVTTAA